LPINGRDVMTLLATIPGMESVSTGQSEGTRAFGLRSGSAEFVVDGAVLNERVWGGIERRPPGLDTIQEFKVEENNSSAKFTRPTTIVMSTKGGTNRLHGALFETNRNSAIGTARQRTDFYDKPPQLNRNEFGVSAGGPVYIPRVYNGKNKTFWFFGYEGYRNINPSTMGFQVPTDAMRQGDFSNLVDETGTLYKIYDPNTTDPATWQRQQFSYQGRANVIDPARISPLAKYLFSITPEPTLPNVNPLLGNNWFGPVPNTGRQWTTSFRIDHRFTDRDQVYGRYTQGNFYLFQQFGSQPMLDGVAGTHQQTAPSRNGAISYVHTFSPTLFNELLMSASREIWRLSTGGAVNYASRLGLPNPLNVDGWPGLYATGLGSYYFETDNTNQTALNYFILDDNVTKMLGRHELQFGFHGRRDQLNVLPDQQWPQGGHDWYTQATALYDPTSSADYPQALPYTGYPLANMFLGSMEYSNQLVRGYYYMRASEYALYLQDNFKVNSRLTLNVGLRWEDRPALREKHNMLVTFDPAKKAMILGTDLNSMYKLGMTTPDIVAGYEALGVKFLSYTDAGLPQNLMYGNPWDFAPRVGFAYRAGDGAKSFVLRGGYHLSYFPVPLRPWVARMRMNTPQDAWFSNVPDDPAQAPDGLANYSMRSPLTTVAGLNSADAISLAKMSGIVPGDPTVTYFAPDQPEPLVQDWNLTVEKEVLPNTVLRVSYIGNHSSNLEQYYNTNDATPAYIWYVTQGVSLPTGTYANVARRPLDSQTFGTINEYVRTGWSNVQGGQVQLEHRFSKGYAFQFFYTLNNVMTAGGQSYSGSSATMRTLNQFLPGAVPGDYDSLNRFLNYQRDITVPKHRVQWNFIADLPFGKGKLIGGNSGKVLDRVIGGWQVAGLGALRTNYFTLPTSIYPNGNKVEIYGYKYPIQDCRSGTCIPGYLWWNGYINPNLINKPDGIMGVPADYKPSGQPINAWPLNPDPNDPMYGYYGTNTVWVTLKDGTRQRVTYNDNLNPWRNQYFPGPRQWNMDASLFKVIAITESVRVRFNADFFNVFNHPGNPSSVTGDGILSTQSSGQAARVTQLTLRLIW
jgi:hypothetical protein